MTPQDLQRQWATHNPFERASVELIKKIQKLASQPQQPKAEPAPF